MPVIDRTKQFHRLLSRKLKAGLSQAVGASAQLLAEKVTEEETTPKGSHRRRGELYRGEVVERSAPGEYPYREFGQLAKAIGHGVDDSGLIAGFGVREEGMHLVWLEIGSHWVSGEPFERLGMRHFTYDNAQFIAGEFVVGFEGSS